MSERIIPLGRQRQISAVTTHGMCYSPEYKSWQSMIARCYKQKRKEYKNYGGRGISVCERWIESFENFYEDMGNRPDRCSLDRIDNDGDYCLENCKWSTKKQQCNNTRVNHILTHNGISMNVTQWAEQLGFTPTVIFKRLNRMKWSVDKTLTTPLGKNKRRAL